MRLLSRENEIPDDILKELVFRFTFICDFLEKICMLDEGNRGNMGMCIDAIKDNRKLDFTDFKEKAVMIHLKFRARDEGIPIKSKLRNIF